MEQVIKNRLSAGENMRYALSRARGITIETDLKPYNQILAKIRQYNLQSYTEEELKALAGSLRLKAGSGVKPDALLPQVYALVREVCIRLMGITPYDEQLLAAIVLHRGKLAELKTGEGKTLAIVFPAVLNSLYGKGVHIMTANDYLARRDAQWMGTIYSFLGIRCGYVQEKMGHAERKAAYQADITYLTAKEAGFDQLRDMLCYEPGAVVQREYHMAIVDEADFILIDEARIPLVIAGQSEGAGIDPYRIEALVPGLLPGIDYQIDKNWRRIYLTIPGQQKVQDCLGCGGMHEEEHMPVFAAVTVALHAHYLLTKDVDYIVRNGKIELVDEFTGRVADKRRWPYGIQTALEAKEGLAIQPEGRIFGSITIQHFLNLYPRLCALTATAAPAAAELIRFYGLKTVIIPPHKPVIRIDAPDRIFTTREAKMQAITAEIKAMHAVRRPVLVGTASIKESQELALRLRAVGVECRVLNAKNDGEEAELIARAGMLGAVTISTNMAGRGTDIKLGGETGIAREELQALGGLYVIGMNRHESVRIDNQLRGRAGRQGDLGLSRFFISLEDPVIVRYGITEFIPAKYLQGITDEPITDHTVVKEIDRAQTIIEDQNYAIRRILRGYSSLVEKQRKYLHALRNLALQEKNIPESLWALCSTHFALLCNDMDKEEVKTILIRIYLYYLDQFWAGHLEFIDQLKEGIHLLRFGGKEPLLEFIRHVSDVFACGMREAEAQTCTRFIGLTAENGQIDPEKAGINAPAGTWTYLINDNPLPGFRVALFADSNIGYAAGAALPLMLFAPFMAAAALVKRISGKFRKKAP